MSTPYTALVEAARAYDAACETRRKAYERWRVDRIRRGESNLSLYAESEAARAREYDAQEALLEAARSLPRKEARNAAR